VHDLDRAAVGVDAQLGAQRLVATSSTVVPAGSGKGPPSGSQFRSRTTRTQFSF
jgi:hypothetical protein